MAKRKTEESQLRHMSNNVFILSTGRAGTNYLSNKISKLDPSSTELHQTKGSRRANIRANIAIKHPRYKDKIVDDLKQNKEKLKNVIDPLKSLSYFYYLKDLQAKSPVEFKEILIVHLVRDPRDFVRSFINWKNRKISGIIAHHLVPFWMPKPKASLARNIGMSKFEHYCWTWKIKNELFYNAFKNESNYHLIRFEDLVSDNYVLKELLENIFNKEISIDAINNIGHVDKNSIASKSFHIWKQWDTKKSKKLQDICGNLMNEFNYGNEDEWQQKITNEE